MRHILLSSACAVMALYSAVQAAEFETRLCTNIGNALEAPQEGQWGHYAEQRYFQAIGETTLDTVRIPVRWSAYTTDEAPYTIDPEWMARVDQVIGWALDEDLKVILNIHHFDELYENPEEEHDKFIALWEQIAGHYQDYPDTLYFELLNEARAPLTGEKLDTLLAEGLATIRKTNPDRIVIIGADPWNSIRSLPAIPATPGDENIVHTFHYYDPHHFTHQKATWAGRPADEDVDWGSEEERAQVIADAELAAAHMAETGYPLFLGEYGVNGDAELERRQRWTAFVTSTMQEKGISTCNWAFTATFPVWNRQTGEWLPGMKEALGVEDRTD